MTQAEAIPLIHQARRGVQTAYRRLFEGFSPAVFATAIRMTSNSAEAEELTQDVFVNAFRALHRYDQERATFGTWLQHIAYNACVSHLRRRGTMLPDVVDEDDTALLNIPDEAACNAFSDTSESHIEALLRAINTLSAEEQHLLTLYYFENYTLQDISYVVGTSIAAVSSRLARIRRKLYLKLSF